MGAAEKIVNETLKKLTPEQTQIVLEWAKSAELIVQDKALPKNEKVLRLRELQNSKALKTVLVGFFSVLHKHTWTERSWPARLALLGVTIGIGTAGIQGAGIAAMGGAIGVPIFLLTASGGALLGTIIQEIKKRNG